MKTCTKCGISKSLDEYAKNKTCRDGRNGSCKTCRAEYDRTNRERRASYMREYRDTNPQRTWETKYRTRAREFGFEPVVESFTREELIARHGDACAHCGGQWNSVDHYPVPVSKGGEHTLDNCRPSCMDCQHQSWRDGFIAKRNPAACKQSGVSESPSKTQAQG